MLRCWIGIELSRILMNSGRSWENEIRQGNQQFVQQFVQHYVTSVTGLDLDVSITLDLCHNRIYINFHSLVVIFDGVSALISTE